LTAKDHVIFIHGLTGSNRAFKHMNKHNENYHYISYDLLGHGKDAGNKLDFSIATLVEQLETIYNIHNIQSAHLCVLSYGCYVGIPFARKHPNKVLSLTVIGGHYNNPSRLFEIFNKYNRIENESYNKWLKAYANEIFPATSFFDKASFLSKKLYIHFGLKLDAAIIKQSLTERLSYNLKEDLAHLKLPILWCMGEEDHLYKDCIYDLKEIVPHVQYVEIKKAGHAANLFQPKQFEAIFLAFLKGVYV
jgi:pimeloyl-ACP methyl ester carboxylesterase